MEYKNETLDFIQRTLNVLENYRGKFDVTILINCGIGILTMIESKKPTKLKGIDPSVLKDWGIDVSKISVCTNGKGNPEIKTAETIVRHLRNAVAHQNLKFIADDNGEIGKILFVDKCGKNETFRFEQDVQSFKSFVTSLGVYMCKNVL